MPNLESLDLGLADKLCTYTLTDLIAEKLRSLLQQVIKNRTRRQDTFELMLLIDKYPDLDETEKQYNMMTTYPQNVMQRWPFFYSCKTGIHAIHGNNLGTTLGMGFHQQ